MIDDDAPADVLFRKVRSDLVCDARTTLDVIFALAMGASLMLRSDDPNGRNRRAVTLIELLMLLAGARLDEGPKSSEEPRA